MKIETELKVMHKIRRLCDYKNELADAVLEYIKKYPNSEAWFLEQTDTLLWSNKYLNNYRHRITNSALELAKKVNDNLGVIAYPHITPVATRGWGTDGGTWAWSMDFITQDGHTDMLGSGDRVRYCLAKKRKLEFTGDGSRFISNNDITAV